MNFSVGYHNYHHNFPQDYKAAEHVAGFNFTSLFIEACAALGLAYNLRTASNEVVSAAKEKNAKKVVTETRSKKLVTWASEVYKNLQFSEQSCEFL